MESLERERNSLREKQRGFPEVELEENVKEIKKKEGAEHGGTEAM